MAWFIVPEINNGYPYNDGFPDSFATSFIANDAVQYPYSAWRIKAGVNKGYPWKYWWFEEDTSSSGDDMTIGGHQSNYPDGFTTSDDGGISDQFNDDLMDDNDTLVTYTNGVVNSALADKMFAITASNLADIRGFLNSTSIWDATQRSFMQSVYGADVYNGILLCKMYPFTIQLSNNGKYSARIFGLLPLYPSGYESEADIPDRYKFYAFPNSIQHFELGNITPDVRQAWEIEGVEYSIYLPFAGTHPVNITDGSYLNIELFVDLFTGIGEYVLRQNRQITNVWRCMLGFDIPINGAAGAMASNVVGSAVNTIGPLMTVAGAAMGLGGAALPGASTAARAATAAANAEIGMAGGAIDVATSPLQSSKFAVSAPQVGGLTSVYSYPKPRLIARIPKMFNGGYGYHQTRGQNRSTTYTTLNTCSGFTKCVNYKCDVIVATTEEKAEIERLLNAGVFL